MFRKRRIAQLPVLDEEARDDACYRAQDRAWSALVSLFDHYNRAENLSYEALGKRISRSRSQVQRWLGSSFNMNLKSLGLLAEGLDADLSIEVKPRQAAAEAAYCHPREAARVRAKVLADVRTSAAHKVSVVSQAPRTTSSSIEMSANNFLFELETQ